MRLAYHAAPILSAIFPIRRKIILENLRTAFPEADEKKLISLVREIYRNFFLLIVEFIKYEHRDLSALMTQITEIEGEEYFNEVGGGEKPFLALTAHIGNWELTAAIGAKIGLPVTTLYRPPTNPYIAAEIERRRN
jgi:KDO2-lipid IV(A) lauroyltransferase